MDKSCPREDDLRRDFIEWRSTRPYRHQKIPGELLTRAQAFADQFGVLKAKQVTGLSSYYLITKRTVKRGDRVKSKLRNKVSDNGGSGTVSPLAYTKFEITRPDESCSIEIESPQGFKLRMPSLSKISKEAMDYFFEVTTR